MRAIPIVVLAALFSTGAWAQSSAQSMKEFASSADVRAMIAKAKNDRKGDQPLVAQRILQLAPYNVNLEYRASVGPASIHEMRVRCAPRAGRIFPAARSTDTERKPAALAGRCRHRACRGVRFDAYSDCCVAERLRAAF